MTTEPTAHTPGPWTCHSGMVWQGDMPIARMDREPGNGTTPIERDANAHLIAAAPDLLAACEALDKWAANPPGKDTIVAEMGVIVLAARTAIAKAKP